MIAALALAPVLLWHAYRGAEEKALAQLIAQFNAQQAEFKVEALAIPYDAFAAKLTSAIPGGHGPDLFIFAHERLGGWAREGFVAPSDWSGPFREALTVDGRVYGYPLAVKSVALFYNRALIQRPPDDLAELARMARAATRGGVYGLAYPVTDFYYHQAFLSGFGGAVFQEPGHRPLLDTPEAARALSFVRGLAVDDAVIPEEPTSVLVTALFNQGRAAMVISGPWFIGEVHGIDYGVAPLPHPMRPFLSVEAALVSGRARETRGAQAFAKWLLSSEAAAVRSSVGGQVAATGAAQGDPLLAVFREAAQRALPMDSSPQMQAVWEPEKRALASALGGGVTPADALAQAQRRLQATTRAAPPRRSPAPYLAALAAAALLGAGALRRRWRGRASGVLRGTARAYAYVAPAFASIALLVALPFAAGLGLSFFHHVEGRYTFVGLQNFADILASRDYRVTEPMSFYFTLAITLLWTVCNVALHVGIGLALALLLKDPLLKLRGVYRVLLIVPWAVPNYITALVWKGMFHRQFGAISALLAALGIEPVSWFTHFSTAFAANVVTNTWLGFPFMMVVALGALQSIPQDLYEAAAVDGASRWKQFRHITLPLLRPALLPAVILGSVWTFNMFNIIYLVSGGEPGGSTDILVSEAYRWAFQRNEQFGFAAAYSTLIFVFLLGYSALTRRIAREPALEAVQA
jgi:arabinogalactan oligomer/maltooligosaccharide transport system permease protein